MVLFSGSPKKPIHLASLKRCMSVTIPRDYHLIDFWNSLRIGIFKALPDDEQPGWRTTVWKTGLVLVEKTHYSLSSPFGFSEYLPQISSIASGSLKLRNHWNPGYDYFLGLLASQSHLDSPVYRPWELICEMLPHYSCKRPSIIFMLIELLFIVLCDQKTTAK